MSLSKIIEFPFEHYVKKHTSPTGEVDFSELIDEFKNMGKMLMPKLVGSAPKMPMEKMMEQMAKAQNLELDYRAKISSDPLENAFGEKSMSHNSSNVKVVPPPFVPYAIDILSNVKRTTKSAIYINVPFCQTRCSFCMFYISPYKKEESKRYTDALIKEMRMWEKSKSVGTSPIHAVYMGGGTPTALEAEDLHRIIKTCHEIFPLANDCEFTVEGRLSYFTDDKIEACLAAGANRFSLGVQSFDTEVRRRMGRLSSKEDLIRGLEHLASYDDAAVIIDLIFGLPGQNDENWDEDLKIVSSLPIDGVDLYQLIMLEGSPLEKLVKAGKMPEAPSKEQRARMYKRGFEYLLDNHFRDLSVSHFGKTFRERNLYNVLAKSDADTLAFGPGAGGKIQGVSFMNVRSYEKWLEKIDEGKKSALMMFVPEKNFKVNLKDSLKEVISQWQSAGLLTDKGKFADLTLPGRFWAVTMVQLLINYLQHRVFVTA